MAKSHPRWRMAKKILTVLFFIAVVVLLVVYAQKIDWQDVWKVIRDYNRTALLSAIGLVIASYLIYGCYDLLGRAYCGHKLAKRQVMLVSFICYAFNLTLSTWVGGIGMRYRLYSRLGLSGATITRIFSLSITTNWLGYILLGGIIFSSGMVKVPERWYISQSSLQILGVVLLLISAFYLWACAFAKKRHLTIKGQRLVLPSWRFAILQMAVSSLNWMAMGAIIWLLLGPQVDYFSRARRAAGQQYCGGYRAYSGRHWACLRRYLSPCFPGKRFRAARLLPPCLPIAPCTTSCRCCWRPSAT
ncbi:inner membrane protein YbhQ [Klebsiella michiganensis]|nr:inner membrane protein YbhQ [Klebsiella michiganensis]